MRTDVSVRPLIRRETIVPQGVADKLIKKRIEQENLSPDKLAEMIGKTIFDPRSHIYQTIYDNIQILHHSTGKEVDFLVPISQNPGNKDTVLKSACRAPNREIIKRAKREKY